MPLPSNMTGFERFMSIFDVAIKILSEIIEHMLSDGDIGDKRIKDLAGWREWEKKKMEPDTSRFLEELRKHKST